MRRGFTLIEVLVALALTGVVVMMAQRLFASATEGAALLMRKRVELDTRANRQRWLEQAFASVAAGQVGDSGFHGDESSLQAATWSVTAQGWPERVPLVLRVKEGWVDVEIGAVSFRLGERLAGARLAYLTAEGAGYRWAVGWSSVIGAPLAVRLILEYPAPAAPDTCLYLIGDRG